MRKIGSVISLLILAALSLGVTAVNAALIQYTSTTNPSGAAGAMEILFTVLFGLLATAVGFIALRRRQNRGWGSAQDRAEPGMTRTPLRHSLAGAVIFFSGIAGAPAASLLVNGSFEEGSADPDDTPAGFLSVGAGATTITGWEVLNNPLEWIGYFWPASDGTNSVDLDGSFTSGIRQTFATTPGNTYLVTFDMAGNLSGQPVIKPLRVSVDGQFANFFVDTTDHQGITYVQQTWSFVADDASATLEFRSLTDDLALNPGGVQGYGAVIDNVSAAVVPAPAAVWLLGTGLAAVVGLARRNPRRPRLPGP